MPVTQEGPDRWSRYCPVQAFGPGEATPDEAYGTRNELKKAPWSTTPLYLRKAGKQCRKTGPPHCWLPARLFWRRLSPNLVSRAGSIRWWTCSALRQSGPWEPASESSKVCSRYPPESGLMPDCSLSGYC